MRLCAPQMSSTSCFGAIVHITPSFRTVPLTSMKSSPSRFACCAWPYICSRYGFNHPSELEKMRVRPLAMEQRPAELTLEKLDGAR